MLVSGIFGDKKKCFYLLHRSGCSGLTVWFIHGLGDWSNVWKSAFLHPALQNWNLYTVDLPGFGRTPAIDESAWNVEQLTTWLETVIQETVKNQQVVLVGHSMGGVIATLLASRCLINVVGLVNIEGNLTEADCFLSLSAIEAKHFEIWFDQWSDQIYQQGVMRRAFRSYHAGLQLTHHPTFLATCHSLVRLSRNTHIGKLYSALSIARLYCCGTETFPTLSREWLVNNSLAHTIFEGAGHWVMSDAESSFYEHLGLWLTEIERRDSKKQYEERSKRICNPK